MPRKNATLPAPETPKSLLISGDRYFESFCGSPSSTRRLLITAKGNSEGIIIPEHRSKPALAPPADAEGQNISPTKAQRAKSIAIKNESFPVTKHTTLYC